MKKRRKRTKSELEKLVEKKGFLCPCCPEESDPSKDEYLVRIYASDPTNPSFDENPEGILNGWNNNHRKLMHAKCAQHPGGLKFMVKTKDALTHEDLEVETVVNRQTCLQYYKSFEFTVEEWSRINGLKRKQTSKFKKLNAKKMIVADLNPSRPGIKETKNTA